MGPKAMNDIPFIEVAKIAQRAELLMGLEQVKSVQSKWLKPQNLPKFRKMLDRMRANKTALAENGQKFIDSYENEYQRDRARIVLRDLYRQYTDLIDYLVDTIQYLETVRSNQTDA